MQNPKALIAVCFGLTSMYSYTQGLGAIVDQLDRLYATACFESRNANSITLDVRDFSIEGGEAIAYYRNDGTLFLANVRLFGEGGREEFTVLWEEGVPVVVNERSVTYDRPLYWDAVVAQQNGDSVVHDPKRAVILERSIYLHDLGAMTLQPASIARDPRIGQPEMIYRLCDRVEILFNEALKENEQVSPRERWMIDPFHHPTPPAIVDSSLCGVVLDDAMSASGLLGTMKSRDLFESAQYSMPHVSFRCSDTSSFVTFFFHYGSGSDQYAEMLLSVALPDTLYGTLANCECTSGAGVFLGMHENEVIAMFGSTAAISVGENGNRLIRYRIEGTTSLGFLGRHNYPSYYMSFEIGPSGLIEYRFGFEYP